MKYRIKRATDEPSARRWKRFSDDGSPTANVTKGIVRRAQQWMDDQARAKILNDFYASVFISDNNVLSYSHSRINDDCFICDVFLPPDRVFSLLTKLKPRASGGPVRYEY